MYGCICSSEPSLPQLGSVMLLEALLWMMIIISSTFLNMTALSSMSESHLLSLCKIAGRTEERPNVVDQTLVTLQEKRLSHIVGPAAPCSYYLYQPSSWSKEVLQGASIQLTRRTRVLRSRVDEHLPISTPIKPSPIIAAVLA